jgi:hypothetical protein
MSELISLSAAADMTARHRTYRETVLDTSYKNQNTLPKCETFSKSDFDAVLAQTGCEAVRIYYGMDSSHCVHAIIVAVNHSNEDILAFGSAVKIIETGNRCPDDCPPSSDLNS